MNKLLAFINKPRSLYWWMVEALVVFGIVMLAALTIQSYSSQRLVEHKIWGDLLKSISAEHVIEVQRGNAAALPKTGVIQSWFVLTSGTYQASISSPSNFSAPDYLVELPAGYYTSEGGDFKFAKGDNFHALIVDLPSGSLITLIDITELENQQNHDSLISLIWIFILLIIIAIMIAWLHRNLVRPVRDLANRMQLIDPSVIGARLPTTYKQQEIQIIAEASNAHLARVEQFIERERSLLDQASHEFRTPIAVISGALDRLKQITLPDASKPALHRIEHAVEDLSETMVALLYLAREANLDAEPVDVTVLHELLPRLIQDHEHLLGNKSAQLKMGDIEPSFIAVPEAMVRIAVSNLIRNAIENTESGYVELKLNKGVISVVDSGHGFNPVEAARRYRDSLRQQTPVRGQGLGLFLIGRITDHFGWKLTIELTAIGTRATLDVSASLIQIS